jgi:HSP20 family protein
MTVRDLIKKERDIMHGLFPWADSLFNRFEDMWEMPMTRIFRGIRAWSPQINVRETDKEIIVSAALPGVEKKDIKLDITDDTMSITAERREERQEGGGESNYRLKEQSYGTFHRSFTLPATVKSDAAKANYKDGILTITLPKQKESKLHKIEIE